ncbi:MAG: hypothetical protein ACYDA3_08090 [Gaiellaceae bacterium]
MSSHTAAQYERATGALTLRTRIVSSLGPLTVAGGIAWAIIQPWRITLLHPHGQGFWWLFVEPPLLAAAAGVAFHWLVARPLVQDLEETD